MLWRRSVIFVAALLSCNDMLMQVRRPTLEAHGAMSVAVPVSCHVVLVQVKRPALEAHILLFVAGAVLLSCHHVIMSSCRGGV